MVEMKKMKLKTTIFILFPVILYGIYSYCFKMEQPLLIKSVPVVTCCWSYFLFYTVDDIAYASLYSMVGIKPKDLWLGNLIYCGVISYSNSIIILSIIMFITKYAVSFTDILLSIFTIFIAIALIGFNTIHYLSNSKKLSIIASVFGLLNIAIIAFPILLSHFYLSINDYINDVISILIFVSIMSIVVSYKYMHHDNIEELVLNSKIYIEGYDKNFFNEN